MPRGFRSNRARSTRRKDWIGATFSSVISTGLSGAGWLIDPSTVTQFYHDPTLIRSVASFNGITLAAASAVGTFAGFAMGLIVVSGDPDTTVVPVPFPSPMTDPEADWIWRSVATVIPGALTGSIVAGPAEADTAIWSKAKRRLPTGMGVLVVFENQIGASVNVNGHARALILE